jgi:hypothetical protein
MNTPTLLRAVIGQHKTSSAREVPVTKVIDSLRSTPFFEAKSLRKRAVGQQLDETRTALNIIC